jgi:uncharacterized protein YegL
MILLWLVPLVVHANPEACINSFTEVTSNAIARAVFSHCIDADPNAERHTSDDINIQDPLTTVRKYCPESISAKMFHSAFYEIVEAGWSTPRDVTPKSRYNAISHLTSLAKKGHMQTEARRELGELMAHIYRDHLRGSSKCLSMEDHKAAIEDMETTLSKVRNIIGTIKFGSMFYLKNSYTPKVSWIEMRDGVTLEDDHFSLKKTGFGEAGDGTAADQLRILLDKPNAVYMSLDNGAPNSALIINEDDQRIDLELFYKSVLKDTTPGTVMFLVAGVEFPDDSGLVNVIAGNAQNQNIMINVILLNPKYVSEHSKVLYQSLALLTGGLMYQTPAREAHQLIPIIESRFQPDQVTIVRNQRIPTQSRGAYIDVPVDSTMSELVFEVYCSALNSIQIYNPRFRPERQIQSLVATQQHFLYQIKNVEPGNWQAVVDCKNDFYIEVRGQSPVDFHFTFASANDNFSTTSPFGLNPSKTQVNGIDYDDQRYLLVHSLGVENVELQSVQFKRDDTFANEKVLPLYMSESLVSAFPMPQDDVEDIVQDETEDEDDKRYDQVQMAKIEGIDQSGFPVLRTHLLYAAKLLLLTDLTKTDFLPGAEQNVTVRVTNAYRFVKLTAGDFDSWVTSISPKVTGMTYYTDVEITLKPPASTITGKMTSVTLTASSLDTNKLLGSLTFNLAAGQRAQPTVESLHIDSEINNKFVVTKILSNIRNDHPEAREATFDALIPPNALITGLKLFVGDQVFDSMIKPAKASGSKQSHKAPIEIFPAPGEQHPHLGELGNENGYSAAHVLQRDAHRYEIRMNIESWDNVTFELTYEDLLERSQDRYQQWVSIAPSQIVPDLQLTTRVLDLGGIKWIKAFPVQSGMENMQSFKPGSQATINFEKGDDDAVIRYTPSKEEQAKFSHDGITGRLVVVYDTNHERACDAMIQDMFFVQTCLPPRVTLKSNNKRNEAPYHVVFALDKSGSMWGTKLDQTKEAFRSMISSLNRDAKFSIVGFNYASQPWRPKLVKANPFNIEEARGFISRLSAGGGTNMHAAILDAIELCNSERDSSNIPCVILFMTDGTPTVGVIEDARILTEVTKSRESGLADIAINIIGFGAGISYSFLSRLAATNNGIARQIFEDTDAPYQMQGFFEEVMKFTDTRRQMKTIEFNDANGLINMDKSTNKRFSGASLGSGQEFIWAGQLNKNLGNFKSLGTQMKITDAAGDLKVIDQEFEFANIDLNQLPKLKGAFGKASQDKFETNMNLAERIYRHQSIRQLIRNRHMAHGAEEYNEGTKALIEMSKGNDVDAVAYLTPVMSMTVTRPIKYRHRRDTFDEFDSMKPLIPHVSHVVQYEYRKLWWKNTIPAEMETNTTPKSLAGVQGNIFEVAIEEQTDSACFDVVGNDVNDLGKDVELTILKEKSLGITVLGKASITNNKMSFHEIRVVLSGTDKEILVTAGDGFNNTQSFTEGSWDVKFVAGDCTITNGENEFKVTFDAESTGFTVIRADKLAEFTGILGELIFSDLKMDYVNEELEVSEGRRLPVTHRDTCWYTDDGYTIVFLARLY